MNSFTLKELALIEDEIKAEEITAKTINWCASLCESQEIRTMLEKMAEDHQLNIALLSQYFHTTKWIQ